MEEVGKKTSENRNPNGLGHKSHTILSVGRGVCRKRFLASCASKDNHWLKASGKITQDRDVSEAGWRAATIVGVRVVPWPCGLGRRERGLRHCRERQQL